MNEPYHIVRVLIFQGCSLLVLGDENNNFIISPVSAVDGTWTHTRVHGHEPESCAYANSATTARTILFYHCW